MQAQSTIQAKVIRYLLDKGYEKDVIASMSGLSSRRMIDYTLQGAVRQLGRKSMETLALNLGESVESLYAKASACAKAIPDNEAFEYIPLKEAQPKCGDGGEESDGEIKGWYAFRLDWLTKRGNPSSMSLFKVIGDSMLPTLKSNDMILVDESNKILEEGLIYLVLVNGSLMVKRLSIRPDGLVFISDNGGNLAPIQVSNTDESNRVTIHGRVIWVGRDL